MSAATRPRTLIVPEVGYEIRAISFNAVVLPAPLGPINA